MNEFNALLQELSEELDTPLIAEQQKLCTLNFNDRLEVSIQYDEADDTLLLGAMIIEISPGKFREKVLATALKANAVRPKAGFLGYSGKNNHLALFRKVPLHDLKGPTFVTLLDEFVEKAEGWKQAIEQGQPGPAFENNSPLSTKPPLTSL